MLAKQLLLSTGQSPQPHSSLDLGTILFVASREKSDSLIRWACPQLLAFHRHQVELVKSNLPKPQSLYAKITLSQTWINQREADAK